MLKFGKYICILSLLVALFVFKPGIALADGGFTASCHHIRAEAREDPDGTPPFPSPDYEMIAICKTENGSERIPHLDLNEHIANNFGQLVWRKDGHFRRSTRNCRLYPNNFIKNITVLYCQGADDRGNWVYSGIILDEQIANYNGDLTVLNGF